MREIWSTQSQWCIPPRRQETEAYETSSCKTPMKTLTSLCHRIPFKEGLAMNGDLSTDLLSFMHENWEQYCECECFACKTTFTLKIDSLGGKYQVFHSPNPVFCSVCRSKPPPSSRDSDFRRLSVFNQGDGEVIMEMWE